MDLITHNGVQPSNLCEYGNETFGSMKGRILVTSWVPVIVGRKAFYYEVSQ
jgi:hypothetical protein